MAELDKETDHDLSESCSSDTSAKRRRLLDHAESLPDEPEGEMLLPGPMTLTGEHGAVPHAETGEHGAEPHAESPSADEGSVHGEEPWSLERLAFSFESVEDMKDYIERTHDVELLRFLARHHGPRMERFSARKKLSSVNDLNDVIGLLRTCQNVLVLTGAGVSVSAGIPDFRSANGIYARLKSEYADMESPACMFDKQYFNENPGPFFNFAHELWPGRFEPTRSHRFIAELEQRGKLLRNYTQNIDTLEQRAGEHISQRFSLLRI